MDPPFSKKKSTASSFRNDGDGIRGNKNSAVQTLEAELKLLKWHKLANESALKAAILKNRQMKRSDDEEDYGGYYYSSYCNHHRGSIPLRLKCETNARLNLIMGEERSKDLQTDEEYVKTQIECELREEEKEQRHLQLQAKRIHSIQLKTENMESARLRKLQCSSIKHNLQSKEGSKECSMDNSMNNDATGNGALSSPSHGQIQTQSSAPSPSLFIQNNPGHGASPTLTRCQSLPTSKIMHSVINSTPPHSPIHSSSPMIHRTSPHRQPPHHLPRPSAIERTKLHFTKFQTKSGPGEPSRPYYCVRLSKEREASGGVGGGITGNIGNGGIGRENGATAPKVIQSERRLLRVEDGNNE